MTRENATTKGHRLLVEGRVAVESAGPGFIVCAVRGSGEFHRVTYGRGGWACSCAARSTCSHLVAVQLVAAVRRPDQGTS